MNSGLRTEFDLQLRNIWLSLGYALLVAVAVLSLIPGPDIGGSDKLLHFTTYAILSGWFSLIVRSPLFTAGIASSVTGYQGSE